MHYSCPVCKQNMPRDLLKIIPHTEGHIVELIKKKHPEWVESGGMCKKCYEYYKNQLHPNT